MKLFIDDIREAPDGWTLATTVTEAIRILSRFRNEIDFISIDHDISYPVEVNGLSRPYPSPETFQAVAYYLADVYERYDSTYLPHITIHSANPVGCTTLSAILNRFNPVIKQSPPATRRAL